MTLTDSEKMRNWWPNAKPFDGSATLYWRFDYEGRNQSWENSERPLWDKFARQIDGTKIESIIDFGAGHGKLSKYLVGKRVVKEENITCIEPNAVLVSRIRESLPQARILLGDVSIIRNTVEEFGKPDLIMANMVLNHIITSDYVKLLELVGELLNPQGIFAYVIPNPTLEELGTDLVENRNQRVLEKRAPWGGTTDYHHRSSQFQLLHMKKVGLKSKRIVMDTYAGRALFVGAKSTT